MKLRLGRLLRELHIELQVFPLKSSSAWHAYKYIDPAESGAVLPILHANGFKISEKTIFGTIDDREIVSLFT